MPRRSARAVTAEHRVLGVVFLALLVFCGWFTHAVFNKKFNDYIEVEMQASKVGLQMPDYADVKLRGVIVGEVLDTRATAEGAVLTLGLFPEAVGAVPSDVTASIAPKTLFGEKFVALDIPPGSTAAPIEAGDVITRSEVAIEVERVLEDLYPLLRTVRPADLNHTLTALATALEGRGEAFGESLETLDGYLRRTNPLLPALVEDLRMLSDVSDVYRAALPELARLLRNGVSSGGTFVELEQEISALFADVSRFSGTAESFLARNGDNLTRLSELGAAQLPVFRKYSPEFPCLLEGIVGIAPLQAEAFRGYTLHINLELLPHQPRGYTPADDPVYADRRGPDCINLPNPPWDQDNLPPHSIVPDLDDGVDEPTGKVRERVAPAAAVDDAALARLLLGPVPAEVGAR